MQPVFLNKEDRDVLNNQREKDEAEEARTRQRELLERKLAE